MPSVPKPPIMLAPEYLKRGDVWARVGLCAAAALVLWVCMSGWAPSFPYRLRQTPLRDMLARTSFEYDDYKITEEFRDRTRRSFLCLYSNDKQLLVQLGQALTEDLFEIKQKSFEEVTAAGIWEKFFPLPRAEEGAEPPPSPATLEEFDAFRVALEKDEKLEQIVSVIRSIINDVNQRGLLRRVEHEVGTGSMTEIEVISGGNLLDREKVNVADVRISEFTATLEARILAALKAVPNAQFENPELIAKRLFYWIRPQVPVTLTFDATNTARELSKALDAIGVKKRTYEPGERLERYRRDLSLRGISAANPLNNDDLDLLLAEHRALITNEGVRPKVVRSTIFFGMSMVMFGFVAQFLNYRHPKLLANFRQFSVLIALMTVALVSSSLVALVPAWRAEIIVIMIFAMFIAIAYNIDLAIFLGALVSVAFCIAHGFGLAEFAILLTASTASAFLCKKIRSRTKLVNAGVIVAALIFPVVLGVHFLFGQPMTTAMLTEALWYAAGAGIAGLTMTAVLPFLESWFDIETDINLLELSDPNHVLLKELIQRAPGTYNHSINVASISESAAEAIGANGLVCRVGSYFHDIGKIRKPEYFIENQSGVNKHDDLVPTMSTLVIIAHVKDGAELARIHGLPKRIVDLIEQHHGTTLVEYFFKRAEMQQAERDAALQEEVDEADYRYPGPRPQTLEAAVLMLADAVESASRTLREPAPSRIENLVFDIARKKLEDGQFDECPITLNQLRLVQKSLIKSLNAVFHARVLYPEKQHSA
jgi:putative nucleotidyltransferase with HDIG domain